MTIVINGRFLLHRITGVERYARELLQELDCLIKDEIIELAIPKGVDNVPPLKNIRVVNVGKLHNRLWEHVSFPLYVLRKKAISLNLCNVAPLISPGIVCIHDMKIKAHPEFFSWKFRLWYEVLFRNATKRAKKIITVSEFSKKEIMKYYGVNEDKIVVIPNAWQHYERIGFDETTLNKYRLKKGEYYFAMGSMEPNKNFKWIAEQAKEAPREVFAIAGSVNEKVFAKSIGFECPTNMYLLGYVTDAEAKTLMRDCKAFLFPSFYEGFGIPPLEAISAGAKKIVVSDIPIMREIFENDANYIDPNTNEELKPLQDCSKKVLRKYSWSFSAKKLNEMLKSYSLPNVLRLK